MKKTISLLLLVLTFSHHSSRAQNTTTNERISTIEPNALFVCVDKTTNLLFPYAIRKVDRGNQDIIVQVDPTVDTLLQIKAAKADFKETNLTVVTAEGKFYSFIVNYLDNPYNLNYRFSGSRKAEQGQVSSPVGIEDASEKAVTARANLHKKAASGKMTLRLNGVYIDQDILYLRLAIANHSGIDYDTELLRFFIRDKKRGKRTASQETEIQARYIKGNTEQIKHKTTEQLVVAVPKFTIPDGKYLCIQLMEKNGGRNMEIHLKGKSLLKAKLL
ncbi:MULTISPECIES: conjugative transposon protein TraN [Chitinophagaceae]